MGRARGPILLLFVFYIAMIVVVVMASNGSYPDWVHKGTYAKYSGKLQDISIMVRWEFISDVSNGKIIVELYFKETFPDGVFENTMYHEVDVETRETNSTYRDLVTGQSGKFYFPFWVRPGVREGNKVKVAIWELKVVSMEEKVYVPAYDKERPAIKISGLVYSDELYGTEFKYYVDVYYDRDTYILLKSQMWRETDGSKYNVGSISLQETNVEIPIRITPVEAAGAILGVGAGVIGVATISHVSVAKAPIKTAKPTYIIREAEGEVPIEEKSGERVPMEKAKIFVNMDATWKLSKIWQIGDKLMNRFFKFAMKRTTKYGIEREELDTKKMTIFLSAIAIALGAIIGVLCGAGDILGVISVILPSVGMTLAMLGAVIMILMVIGFALGVFKFKKIYILVLILVIFVLEIVGAVMSIAALLTALQMIALAIIIPLSSLSVVAGVALFTVTSPETLPGG